MCVFEQIAPILILKKRRIFFSPQRKSFFILDRIVFSIDESMISSLQFDIKVLVCFGTKKLVTVKRVEDGKKS